MIIGASGIATADHVKDVAQRSASAKKGEDQAKAQSRANDIKLKEQDATKSEAAKSEVLPCGVDKESPSDSPPADLSMSVKPGGQVGTEQPAQAKSPTAEIQNKSTKPKQEKVQRTMIGPKDSTEKKIIERSKPVGDLKPEKKVSVDPALQDQNTKQGPEEKRAGPVEKSLQKSDTVTSDQNKVPPTVWASEVKRVEPGDAASAPPASYSVDPELAHQASEPKKLLTDQNIIPAVGELPSFSSNLTDPKVGGNGSKEVGSSIQTQAVTVLAKNVGNQVDKEVLMVAGQQKDSNERLSGPAVGNTDSLNSCREEPESIIMQHGAEQNASKPGKPVTLLKPDTAEQTQAAGTDAQEQKNTTNVMEKEQVTNKPSASETRSESNISVDKKAKGIAEETEKQIKAGAENKKRESKELQARNESVTKSNLEEIMIVNQTRELKDLNNANVGIKEGKNKEISNRTADIEVLKDHVSSMAILNGTESNKAVEDTSLSAISKSLSAKVDMQTKSVKVPKNFLETQVPQIDASQGKDKSKRAKVTAEGRKTKESSTQGAHLDEEPKTQRKEDSSDSSDQNNTANETNRLKEDKAVENKGTKRDKDVPKTKVDSEQTGAEVAPTQREEHQQVKVNGPIEMVRSGNAAKKDDDISELLTKDELVKDKKVKESTGRVVPQGEIPEPKPFAVNTQGDEGLGETSDSKTINENETVDKQVSLNTATATVPDGNKNKAMSFANDSADTSESCEAEEQEEQTAGVLGNQNKVTEQEDQRVKPPKIDSTQESELSLSENSGQEQKDKISVSLGECPETTDADKKDGDTKNITKDKKAQHSRFNRSKTNEVMLSQTSELKPQGTQEDSPGGSKEGAFVEKTSKTETPTLTENQKPLIPNKVNLQDSSVEKILGRDDNQQATPLQEQKSGLLGNQDKGIIKPKINLEEKIKTGRKESKELKDSPKESSVLINGKMIREMDKKQVDLSQGVPGVKIKEAQQDDQKESIKDGKDGEKKMPNHTDAQEDGGNTKAQTKTSIGLKTQQQLQTKGGASNANDTPKLNVSDFLRAQGKKSATQSLQLNNESPSSWLDVEHQPKKKKGSRRILDASASEDESLEPHDLDEFVRSIREGSTPFTQPLKKHSRKKTPSPAMPAIKEDNFDPDSFQFGLRKEGTIFKDPSPAMMIKQNSANRKGRGQENSFRQQTEARLKSADGVDGKTGVQGGTDAEREGPPVNGEEAGKLSSRLQRISILTSLMSSPWSSRKVREEVASAKNSEVPPPEGKAGAASPPLGSDKQGVDKGKSQSPAGGAPSALSQLAGGPASPPAAPSFSEVKLPAHLEKYVKKSKSETETSQAPKQPPQTKPSPKGSAGKSKASMAGAPSASSLKSSANGLSTSKHKVRPELWAAWTRFSPKPFTFPS